MEGWGTWEELVLASSVLRHGAARWEAVVAELRARTLAPGRFTSEICKAKYEDLQKQHSTCSRDLLEELRKQRIAELKQTVEKFDGSIGFLQMKLQTLRAKKDHSSSVEYQSSPLESPAQTPGKDPSKDGLSAGSFTQDRSSPAASLEAEEIRPSPPTGACPQEKRPVPVDLVRSIHMELGVGVKKKRGKRKRRGCGQVQDIKEENIDETVLEPTNRNLPLLARVKVQPASDCDLGSPLRHPGHELTRVLDMISSNEYASIFRRRLDSQKRARYRKIVRRHMDLDTIKSRIDGGSITSIKELLRDVLLLATNAAVFYSRNTREHKYAVFLKGVVVKLVMEHQKNSFSGQTDPAVATSPDPAVAPVVPAIAPPVKPASPDPGPGPLNSQRSSNKLRSNENISKAPQRPRTHGKPKDSNKLSRPARKANGQTQNGKDGPLQRSPAKLAASVNQLNAKVDGSLPHHKVNSASVYEHDFNEGSRQQQPQPQLPASVGERDISDLPRRRRRAQVKLAASVSDPKERKRARRK